VVPLSHWYAIFLPFHSLFFLFVVGKIRGPFSFLLISLSLSLSLSLSPPSSLLFLSLPSERVKHTEKRKRSQYLSERHLRRYHTSCENVNKLFERSLVFMNKMPRIWITYCTFLSQQPWNVTRTRHAFDRSLRSLPITQHDRVWEGYLQFARSCRVPETTVRVFRRYLQLEPSKVEEFLEYLVEVKYVQEAAEILLAICGDETFVSSKDKSQLELWVDLCDLLSHEALRVQNIDVESVIRHGIRKFSDCVGRLWTSLAEYYIRLSQYEKARDVFEEGMSSVKTVRDFSLIWEAYTVFLDGLVSSSVEREKDSDLSRADWEADVDVLLLRWAEREGKREKEREVERSRGKWREREGTFWLCLLTHSAGMRI
jgi:hypothetical protein